MKASALLILLLFPSLALAQQQFYGTTAASVLLPAPADPSDAKFLAIRPGDVITTDNIRATIQALYGTGRYRTITVDAESSAGGTQVSFLVTAQHYFSTFLLDPPTLLDRPITSYFSPPYGKKFSSVPGERLATDTAKLLEEVGYFNAKIEPKFRFDEKTKLATVVLKTTAHMKPAKVRSTTFSGVKQKIVSDKDLKSALNVSNGDTFNASKIGKGVGRIRQKFLDKGYLTAKVQVDTRYDDSLNVVDLDFQIDPGKTTVVRVTELGGGKSEISDKQLRTLVPIFEEGTVDADLVEEGRQNIVTHYQQLGYFDASATATMSPGVDDSVYVEYSVQKGEQHRVRSLRIEGSAFFTEAEILKKMKTKEGMSGSHGLFSPELLASDIRLIQTMYQKAGFRSTNVTESQEQTGAHDIDITIQIKEGLRSTLDEITFTGNQSFPEPELWKVSGIQADQVFSTAIIDNARDAVGAYYSSRGFSEARIETRLDFDSINDTVNVRFDISEGLQYRIGWILVGGNTHTAEKVITRTSGLKQDDPYNPEAILEAQQKLYSLGIFNRVEIVTIDQDLGSIKNLLIQVEDAKPILLTPGFGITERGGPKDSASSQDTRFPIAPRATIELSDINLFGLARTISARVRGGPDERQFQASYRDPRLFNHEIQGIAALTFDKTKHPAFTSNEVDFSIQTVRKLSKNETFSIRASYETVNLQDINVNPNLRSFPTAEGTIQIARIGSSFIADRRDSVSDPTRGTFATSSLEIASKHLASEVNFVSLFLQGSHFNSVRGGVIASSVRVGWKQPYGGDVELPISERFFAGGSTTLRGFRFDEAGPGGGGQLMTIGNVEYRIPLSFLPLKNFGGALFYDSGNVFENRSKFKFSDFTHSAGFGLRYKTPLGPIRVDLGFNLRPKPGIAGNLTVDPPILEIPEERRYVVFFTLGHAF